MLINPDENRALKSFLFNFFDNIKFLTTKIKKSHTRLREFKWALVLNYILIKILGNNCLSTFLHEKYTDECENYKIIGRFELRKNIKRKLKYSPEIEAQTISLFFQHHLITPLVFLSNLYEMRTNLDLKMLFALFGGDAVINHKFNEDGTGAIFFEKADSLKGEKIIFLKTHLQNKEEKGNRCIALNSGFHWKPLRSIESLSYFSSNRFYLFKYDMTKAYIMSSKVHKFLKSEIQKNRRTID
jgi:hypothetical protein